MIKNGIGPGPREKKNTIERVDATRKMPMPGEAVSKLRAMVRRMLEKFHNLNSSLASSRLNQGLDWNLHVTTYKLQSIRRSDPEQSELEAGNVFSIHFLGPCLLAYRLANQKPPLNMLLGPFSTRQPSRARTSSRSGLPAQRTHTPS